MFERTAFNFRRLQWVLSGIFALVCLVIIAVYSLIVISEHNRARYNFELNIWKDLNQEGRQLPFNSDSRCQPSEPTVYEIASGERPPVASALKKNFNVFNHRIYRRLLLTDALVWLVVSVAGYYFIAWILRPVRDNVSAQQEFIANASHELKTPITTIKTELSLLSDEKMSANVRESLTTIDGETENLQQLVEKLLLMVRESEQDEEPEMVRLDKFILPILARWEKVFGRKNLQFVLGGDKNVTLLTRERMLGELLDLLLDNAGKYADSDTTVRLEIKKSQQEVFVKVINQGIGIPSSDQEKIWGRFFRVTARRVQAESGSGLGLAIAKEIAANLGGSIQLISGEPSATIFRVSLPQKEKF